MREHPVARHVTVLLVHLAEAVEPHEEKAEGSPDALSPRHLVLQLGHEGRVIQQAGERIAPQHLAHAPPALRTREQRAGERTRIRHLGDDVLRAFAERGEGRVADRLTDQDDGHPGAARGLPDQPRHCPAAATRKSTAKNPKPKIVPTARLAIRAGRPPKPREVAVAAAVLAAAVTTTIRPRSNSSAKVRK
jgi:hypothetical protein